MSLYDYFKPACASILPPPDGPLSRIVPSSSIQAANEAVKAALPDAVQQRERFSGYMNLGPPLL